MKTNNAMAANKMLAEMDDNNFSTLLTKQREPVVTAGSLKKISISLVTRVNKANNFSDY